MKQKLTKIIGITLTVATVSNIALAYDENDKNTLIESKQCINCDLSGYEFHSFADFKGDMDNINLMGSNLQSIKMGYEIIHNANFSHTDLSNAELRLSIYGIFAYGEFLSPSVDFSSSKFTNTTLLGQVSTVNYSDSDFSGLNARVKINKNDSSVPLYVTHSNFKNGNFTNANLYHSAFLDSDFTNATFIGANLEGADFDGSEITLEQIKQANNICDVGLPNGEIVIGRMHNDGTIATCDGYSSGDENIDGYTIL